MDGCEGIARKRNLDKEETAGHRQRLRPGRDRPLFETKNKSACVCPWREKASWVQDEVRTHMGLGLIKPWMPLQCVYILFYVQK